MVKRIVAFLVAAAAVAAFTVIAGSQINLNALGVAVTPQDRLTAAGRDLVGAGPLLAAFLAPAFLITALLAGLALRYAWLGRAVLYAAAGGGAVLLVLGGLSAAFPMPVLAAARTMEGATALILAGALGGLVYALLGPKGLRHA